VDPRWKKKQPLVMVRICCEGRCYWEEEKSLLYCIVVMFRPREGPIWKGLLSVEKKKGNDVGQ
jgi:hypothetical protein